MRRPVNFAITARNDVPPWVVLGFVDAAQLPSEEEIAREVDALMAAVPFPLDTARAVVWKLAERGYCIAPRPPKP